MIFYHMATLIQRYDKESFHFKNERLTEFYRLSDAAFYDCIITTYKFIKPFLDNKISIFEEYRAFKQTHLDYALGACLI